MLDSADMATSFFYLFGAKIVCTRDKNANDKHRKPRRKSKYQKSLNNTSKKRFGSKQKITNHRKMLIFYLILKISRTLTISTFKYKKKAKSFSFMYFPFISLIDSIHYIPYPSKHGSYTQTNPTTSFMVHYNSKINSLCLASGPSRTIVASWTFLHSSSPLN